MNTMPIWAYLVGISAAVATMLVTVGTLIYKTGRWTEGRDRDREDLRDFKRTIEQEFRHFRESVERRFDQLRGTVNQMLLHMPAMTVREESPIALTELGHKVAQEVNARRWAERTAPRLAAEVEGKDEYGVQETCKKYAVETALEPDMEADVRASAYRNGLDRMRVIEVLAVELRDQFLDPTSK